MVSDPDEMVDVFAVRCPLGDGCSKKGSLIAKKLSEEEARQCIVNHLTGSPYHKMPELEASVLAQAATVESWPEAKHVQQADDEDEGQEWSSGSGYQGGNSLALVIGARSQHARNITLPRAQLKACVDSLKRARMAAESSGQLCGRASRAFYEEAACITGCQDVLESYLAD
jgi:hypothetical protein